MIVATEAHYRRLAVDRLGDLEGAGIYYAATDTEVRLCAGSPVVVVGGGNSAGQAALHLAKTGCDVTLVIRAQDLSASMSSYLADRIAAQPQITLASNTVVAALHGDNSLAGVTLQHSANGLIDMPAAGLFSFIGAAPATEWLAGQVVTDDRGFIRTDRDLDHPRRALGHGGARSAAVRIEPDRPVRSRRRPMRLAQASRRRSRRRLCCRAVRAPAPRLRPLRT